MVTVERVVVLDQPPQMIAFHKLQCYHALKLEIKTGMGHSQGSVKRLVETKYTNKRRRTKKATFVDFHNQLVDEGIINGSKIEEML